MSTQRPAECYWSRAGTTCFGPLALVYRCQRAGRDYRRCTIDCRLPGRCKSYRPIQTQTVKENDRE